MATIVKGSRRQARVIANGMLRTCTPIEDYHKEWGLFVKREDRACLPPGPPFSKTRGVYAHLAKRPEQLIGVLDTYHSQAGHAVARACQVLGKQCVNFYPNFKHEPGPRAPQLSAQELGAELYPIPAGRSAILYHQAKKLLAIEYEDGYMIANALKLKELVEETAAEVPQVPPCEWVLIPASSGTIAAGVIQGLRTKCKYIVHLGYDRSEEETLRYVREASGISNTEIEIVNEGYAYKDVARPGPVPPWPCNEFYDLKAVRWWMEVGREIYGEALLWNIG